MIIVNRLLSKKVKSNG